MNDFTYHPDIEVEFQTRNGFSFTTKELISYTSQRSLKNPAAQASITFQGERFVAPSDPRLEGRKIVDVLGLYDLCTIRIRDALGKYWVDLFGFVDPVSPAIGESGGVPQNATQIQVMGLGQALIDYQIFWHHFLAGRSNVGNTGFLTRAKGKIPKGRPHEVIEQLFDTFMNDEFVFRLADGRKLNGGLVKRFDEFTDGLATTGLNAMGANGALWPTLKRYADQPWGEIFVDVPRESEFSISVKSTEERGRTRGLQTEALYLRPTPFDLENWEKLADPGSGWGFTYDEEDRMGGGEDLQRSTNSVYNFFWVSARAYMSGFDQLSLAFSQSNGKLPIYDKESISRIGIRRLEQPTEYVQPMSAASEKQGKLSTVQKTRAGTKKDSWNELLLLRTQQLQRWYGYQKGYMKGPVTMRGRIGTHSKHGARIGGILTRTQDEHQLYIEGIQQSWSFPGPHTTTLNLIRGHDPTDYRDYLKNI